MAAFGRGEVSRQEPAGICGILRKGPLAIDTGSLLVWRMGEKCAAKEESKITFENSEIQRLYNNPYNEVTSVAG
jgi:hypothetical protein